MRADEIELVHLNPTVNEVIILSEFYHAVSNWQLPTPDTWRGILAFVARRVTSPRLDVEQLAEMEAEEFGQLLKRIVRDTGQVPDVFRSSTEE